MSVLRGEDPCGKGAYTHGRVSRQRGHSRLYGPKAIVHTINGNPSPLEDIHLLVVCESESESESVCSPLPSTLLFYFSLTCLLHSLAHAFYIFRCAPSSVGRLGGTLEVWGL